MGSIEKSQKTMLVQDHSLCPGWNRQTGSSRFAHSAPHCARGVCVASFFRQHSLSWLFTLGASSLQGWNSNQAKASPSSPSAAFGMNGLAQLLAFLDRTFLSGKPDRSSFLQSVYILSKIGSNFNNNIGYFIFKSFSSHRSLYLALCMLGLNLREK